MPYRRFTDSQGKTWRVWDVLPSLVDRRLAIRRIRSIRIQHPDRRVLPDRRVDMSRSRLFFSPSERGWLCFESGDLRKRLSPAPEDWAVRNDADLEALCGQATEQVLRKLQQPAG